MLALPRWLLRASAAGAARRFASAAVEPRPAPVTLFAFRCGSLRTQTQRVLRDTRHGEPMEIPVTFFVVRRGHEWVAFDTGCNVLVAGDDPAAAAAHWGAKVVLAYAPRMRAEDEFQAQLLRAFGLRPADLRLLALSHGHLDHAGAVGNLAGTGVPVLMQASELAAVRAELAHVRATGAASAGAAGAYIAGDFARIDELRLEAPGGDGVLDIFGDASVVLFPSPGHSPGHQSMLVRTTAAEGGAGKTYILTGDAAYTLENLERAIAPGLAFDFKQALQSLLMFKVLRSVHPRRVVVVPSHDPAFWASKPLAPAPFVVD